MTVQIPGWSLTAAISYKILLAVLILAGFYFLATLVRKTLTRLLSRIRTFDKTFLPFLETILTYSLLGIGVLIVLNLFGVNTNSVLTVLGAAGLAVALALKDVLSNLASGIFLLAIRPFKNDETIEINGMVATVKRINMFLTKLETPDGIDIEYPNTGLWTNAVKNFDRNKKRRMSISIDISYNQPVESGLAVLNRLIEEEPRFLTAPAPKTMVAALKESAVTLQLRAWTKKEDYWDTFWEMNKKIKLAGENGELNFSYPQLDVHMKRE